MTEIRQRRLKPFQLTVTGIASAMAAPGGGGTSGLPTGGETGGGGGGGGLGPTPPPAPPIPSPQVATPEFDPAAGVILATDDIAITCDTAGATIYYTTDGSTPTRASTVYAGAFNVAETTTVKAFATAPGYLDSVVATATYQINLVDGTLWLGAWAFAANPPTNVIASPHTGMGNFGTTDPSGVYFTGGQAQLGPDGPYGGGVSIYAEGNHAPDKSSQICSLACKLKTDRNAVQFYLDNGPYLTLGVTQVDYLGSEAAYPHYLNGIPLTDTSLGSNRYTAAVLNAATFTHVAIVARGDTGTVYLYLNGTLARTFTGGAATSGLNGIRVRNWSNISGGGTTYADNVVGYAGELSASAIAALAAGNLPDSTGFLN